MQKSRTRNVSVNITIGLICQGVTLITSFISRTVFIKTLGADYLGVNGLFSNVLSILSFAELGIGNAIIFSLYKPIATGDQGKIASLMELYKRCYRVIGIVIAVIGLCLTPFLGYIIKNKPDIPESLILLYWLFLADAVVSYFFVYKRSLIIADQKNYVVLVVIQTVTIAKVVVQIIFLYLTHNFIIYLLINIGTTLVSNIATSVVADKMYPFLRQKAVPLAIDERKEIFKNVRALALYKFGSVMLNGTDNILVSALIGVREVGLVSNYVLLNSSCKTILVKVTDAFTASVGNLNAISDDKKKYDVFNNLFLIVVWLYGFASVGLATVANPLIKVWLGENYLLSQIVSVAIVFEFYSQGIQFATYTYRTTLGYFVQSRFVPIWMAFLNIVLSILFCKWIGLPGIFFATPISRICGSSIVDPYLIYTRTFHKNPFIYWGKYVCYTLIVVAIGILCNFVVMHISINGWLGITIQIIVVTVIFNAVMMMVFCKTKVFRDLVEHFKTLIKNKN